MSDIKRFVTVWGGVVMHPSSGGDWVRYTDHRAEVERVTRQNSENFAEIERLTRAQDRLRDRLREALEERNNVCYEAVELREKLVEAQAEVERLRANSQAILDSSRPTDEDIWREAFMRCVSEYVTGEKRVIIADAMLAEYRKRWPR